MQKTLNTLTEKAAKLAAQFGISDTSRIADALAYAETKGGYVAVSPTEAGGKAVLVVDNIEDLSVRYCGFCELNPSLDADPREDLTALEDFVKSADTEKFCVFTRICWIDGTPAADEDAFESKLSRVDIDGNGCDWFQFPSEYVADAETFDWDPAWEAAEVRHGDRYRYRDEVKGLCYLRAKLEEAVYETEYFETR